MSDDFKKPVILDNGSYSIKIGFAGDATPKAVIGSEAWEMRDEVGYNKVKHPIDYRNIGDWDAMERIWRHIFENVLKIDPSQHPILILEASLNPMANKENFAQVFFDIFKAPRLTILNTEVMALMALDLKHGISIDLGYQLTSIVPVYEGFPLAHAVRKMRVGGRDVDAVSKRYYQLRKTDIFEDKYREYRSSLEELKHNHYYLRKNSSKNDQFFKNFEAFEAIKIGDVKIPVGEEKYMAPEVFFQTDKFRNPSPPLPEIIVESINSCDEELTGDLFNNIVLSGGSTMISNFQERMELELKNILPKMQEIKIYAPENRNMLGWIGTSRLIRSHPEAFDWFEREEFEEKGISGVHKCNLNVWKLNLFDSN